jgi:dolichyl-phosphate beta-glucosyltransferase
MHTLDCTIVIPCYNERNRLDVGAFCEFLRDHHDVGFLLVNDGSTDGTHELLEEMVQLEPDRLGVLHLERNGGKAEAVRRGMLEAAALGALYAGFWDADLATPLEAIPEFVDHLDSYPELQMVMGARVRLLGRQINRRPMRHYLGRAFATAASVVLGAPVYDTQCGAKLFRMTPDVIRLFEVPFRSRWIFDVEILARFLREPHEAEPDRLIHEIPLESWRDVAGSKVRPRDFARAFWELVEIHHAYRRTKRRAPAPSVHEAAELVTS